MKNLNDEKGKFFNTHVDKIALRVIMATPLHLIRGTMHLAIENRLKDELNGTDEFVAITHAKVASADGKTPLYDSTILIVNKEQIVWVIPEEEHSEAASRDN